MKTDAKIPRRLHIENEDGCRPRLFFKGHPLYRFHLVEELSNDDEKKYAAKTLEMAFEKVKEDEIKQDIIRFLKENIGYVIKTGLTDAGCREASTVFSRHRISAGVAERMWRDLYEVIYMDNFQLESRQKSTLCDAYAWKSCLEEAVVGAETLLKKCNKRDEYLELFGEHGLYRQISGIFLSAYVKKVVNSA